MSEGEETFMEVNNEENIITIDDDEDETASVEHLKSAGNDYFQTGRYKDAIQCYSCAIELEPNKPSSAVFHGNRAACQIMLGKYDEAVEDCMKSVSLDPTYLKGYTRLLKCKTALGDFSGARACIDQYKAICGDDANFANEVRNFQTLDKFREDAERAYEKQDYRMVVHYIDRIISMGVSSSYFKLLKAECLTYLGRYQEAQEIANSILLFDKQNGDAVFVRGLCLYYEDNIDLAISHFQRALKLAPDHKKALKHYRIARSLKQKKEEGNKAFNEMKLTAAHELYTSALAIDSSNSAANAKLFFNRATVYHKLDRIAEAVTDCTAALKLDPKYLKALLRRAKCYMDSEDYEKAIQDYEEAFRQDGSRENKRLLQEAKIELKKSQRKDYYKILGVSKTASTDEIKRAYRKRALVHHPDRHTNASESERLEQERQFKEVGEAYGVLSDPKKRARYDGGEDLIEREAFVYKLIAATEVGKIHLTFIMGITGNIHSSRQAPTVFISVEDEAN